MDLAVSFPEVLPFGRNAVRLPGNPVDLPYQQRALIQNPHVLTLGDAGGVYLFVCPRCPGLPMAHRHDCF